MDAVTLVDPRTGREFMTFLPRTALTLDRATVPHSEHPRTPTACNEPCSVRVRADRGRLGRERTAQVPGRPYRRGNGLRLAAEVELEVTLGPARAGATTTSSAEEIIAAVGHRAALGLQDSRTMKATTTEQSPAQQRETLHDIVKGTRTVMLLSHGKDSKIEGRPMALVKIDDDTTIYLVTGIDSKKVADIVREPRVSVSVQARDGFVILDGEVLISQDRSLIDALWEDSWKVWFPDGAQDPTIAILIVTPNEGTYWNQDLGHTLSYLYRMVKARVLGSEMKVKLGDQATVDLHKH